MALLLGTCGWSYQEWVGLFYPNNRLGKLTFYASVFDTVEVDSSFYKIPSKQMVSGWIRNTKPGFKFSLKIPKIISHDKRLAGVQDDFNRFIKIIEPISQAGKLGCLLLQLAPSFTYKDRHLLESFLSKLPPRIHFAVEFRHESWDRNETWQMLSDFNVSNTITDSPIKFLSKPVVTATTHAFVRWHGKGNPVWYDYTYSQDELAPWAGKVRELSAKVPVIYAYFNNHYGARAPLNALQFLEMNGTAEEKQKKIKARIEKRLPSQESNARPKLLTDFL